MAETETKSPQPETGSQKVQLGVGTLIIIALIVTMCSGGGKVDQLQRDNAALKQQIGEIDQKLDTLLEKDRAISSSSVEAPAAPSQTP